METNQLRNELTSIFAADPAALSLKNDKSHAEIIETCSGDKSFHPTATPDAVVAPTTVHQVQRVVQFCSKHNIPLTARGAGTGVEGGCIPYAGGIVLHTTRLRQIHLEKDDLIVRVGPGLLKNELNTFLQPHGLMLGPDPSSNPSVGGMASTRGSGLSTPMYGTTKENVVSLQVVTPTGQIITTRRPVRKSSTGYDLTSLFIGAEGTLGIITEITFRLWPLPTVRLGALALAPDLETAANFVVQVLRSGLRHLARCELLNAEAVVATNKLFETQMPVRPTLLLEFHANASQIGGVREEAEIVRKAAETVGCTSWKQTDTAKDLEKLWEARRGCYYACIKARGKTDHVFTSDICVPIGHLVEAIVDTENDFHSHGMPCLICAHAADGKVDQIHAS
eukprot:TRINITY_DN60975_c0_g1_i1.p1 TRINITY_DN60975_c0_g1~~TRINITY_DN60975_c0_g1_i1.p1  ORF type:complete len:394 (-),score=-2.95 TRINITY_DN60975_c0_g1_i1:109-1290(-)